MAGAKSDTDALAGAAPAVVRAAAVLDALAMADGPGLTLSELARGVGVAKSSMSSVCAALEGAGLIQRDEHTYALGRRLVELGGAYLARTDAVAEFYAFCESSPLLASETVRLSALAGTDILVLARYEGHPPLRLTSGIGDRFPASACAQGKALLARLDDAEIVRLFHGIDELPRMTALSVRTLDALLEDVHRTRARGFALDEQESVEHVIGLAVEVPTRGARMASMAVSSTLLDAEATPGRRDDLVAALRALASNLGNPMHPHEISAPSCPL